MTKKNFFFFKSKTRHLHLLQKDVLVLLQDWRTGEEDIDDTAARGVAAQDLQLLRCETHDAQCCMLGLLELKQLLQQQRAVDLERSLQGGLLQNENAAARIQPSGLGQCFVCLFFVFNTSFIPCSDFGSLYLGNLTVAARTGTHLYQCVCSIFVCPNNGMPSSVWDTTHSHQRVQYFCLSPQWCG